MYINALENGIGLLGRLTPPAAGPRRPAEAGSWGAAEVSLAQLRSLGEAPWGGPAGGRHGPFSFTDLHIKQEAPKGR